MSITRQYLQQSRDLGTSLVLVLPIFVIYQVGVLMTGGVRNGVDFITTILFSASGGNIVTYLAIQAAFGVVWLIAVQNLRRKGQLHPKVFPWLLVESAVYALFFAQAVNGLMRVSGVAHILAAQASPAHTPVDALVLSLGAGLYEELVFRLLLMGGIYRLMSGGARLPSYAAAVVAVLVSSLIFSAVHHIGPLADPFSLDRFFFRAFAGVLLATIFHVRGFAVAAYTHAFYDIGVMLL